MDFSRLLGQDLDFAAHDARATENSRLGMIAVASLFVPFLVGGYAAMVWPVAAVLTWLWGRACRRRLLGDLENETARSRSLRRLNYLCAVIATSTTWTALPLLYWSTGDDAQQIAATIILLTQLLNAQLFAFRSKTVFCINAGLPTIALVMITLVLGGYSGMSLAFMAVTVFSAVGYMALSAIKLAVADRALREAQSETAKAYEAKSIFMAMMGHELRTPLNGLLGMARALQLAPLDPSAADQVRTMVRSGGNLLSILNDMLDFSKIEAGKFDLDEKPFDVADLCDDVVALWAEAAAAKGVALTCRLEPDASRWLVGDANRLRQILLNLVSNALKFTDHGEVRLTVSAPNASPRTLSDGAAGVAFVVTDTGIGMTEEQCGRLFQVYSQADASTASRFGGTGLGLAICQRLAGLMGGTVTAESRIGEGSIFRLSVPLATALAEDVARDVDDDGVTVDLTDLHLLIVDDNRTNQVVAAAVLGALGATTVTADGGRSALDLLSQTHFDAVLMDVRMPGMDGIEAVRRIRSGEAGRTDVPIVALTADSGPAQEARLLGLGFDAVQTKPVQPSALSAAILCSIRSPRMRIAA